MGRTSRVAVAQVTSILDEAGYMAEWRKTGRNSYELTQRNCSGPGCCQQLSRGLRL